jgi:IS5 family transposase
MRVKSSAQGYLDFTAASSTKIVVAYRQKYAAISQVLEANPRLLTRVHNDLAGTVSLSEEGRRSGYTSEQVLRALVVMFVEGDSYRRVVIRVANSEFLQNFVKLELGSMMGFSFLCKAYGAIAPETWQAMNRALGQYARRAELISAEKVRVDTTALETTVHYPTDSSLLWDSFRTLARLMKSAQRPMRCQGLTHRFHVKKVKKLAYYISRNAAKRSKREQRRVKKVYGTLILHGPTDGEVI